ncbi:MAG: TniQ family protein [Terriglobia bacterium]
MPPRSRLYSLTPVGISTPFVESLTGYVSRLADAHAVSVGSLVDRELSVMGTKPPRAFGPFVPRDPTTKIPYCFKGRVRAVNGWGETARRWVGALERATLQTNLRFLTLLSFEGVFSSGRLFRRNRAWCATCYEDWKRTGDTVYEPLLWTIRVVTICLRHGQPLVEVCPHCGDCNKPLGAYARPGYCSKCMEWLGRSGTSESTNQCDDEVQTRVASRRTQAVAELLAASPQLKSPGTVFKANFRACVEATAEGNVLAFAQASQTSNPSVTCVLKGRGLPEMGTLLRICHEMDIPLTAFLVDDPGVAALHWERGKEVVLKNHRCRRVPLSRTREQVLVALQEAVREQPPPSLSDIARRLNFKSVEWLRHAYPVHSKQIVVNYRKSGRSHWWRKPGAARICEPADLRDLLERSLAKEHSVSPGAIAVSLGYANEGCIQNRFPELCRAIRRKIKQEKKARISAMQMALKNALNDEPPPSLDEVARRLGYTSSGVLRTYFSTLCDRILARRQLHRKLKLLELKKKLQATLLEWPAPCIASVCRRFNVQRGALQKMYPHEYAALRSRYLHTRREIWERRLQQLRQEVHRVVENLHREGKYPSIGRVSTLLSKTMLNNWPAVRAAVKAARQELRLPDLY